MTAIQGLLNRIRLRSLRFLPRHAVASWRRRLCKFLLLLLIPPASHAADADSVRYSPAYSGNGRLLFFFNQQDDLQESRFVTEGSMFFDFELLSLSDRWLLDCAFEMIVDMGDSVTQNLPFSPKEMAYEFNPFLEYRDAPLLYRLGWTHVCQHLIYKDQEHPWYTEEGSDIPPDVYYNRLSLGVGSREIRPEIMRRTFFPDKPGAATPLVIWYVEAGWYVRSLLGIDTESLYGDNDWAADVIAEIRVPLVAADSWLLLVNSRTQVLMDTDNDLYTRETVQLEVAFPTRGYGSSIFLGSHLIDEHPRDSREGLVELGATFYF